MKRYGNLYTKIWDMDNIREAHHNAQRGKQHYHEVQMVNADEDKYLMQIQVMLRDKTFRNSEYEIFIKTDSGKEREIYKLPYFPDRIIHHCVMQVLEPIWMSVFISDTYAALKGRGIHKGVKRVKLALRDVDNTQYCLKFDVRKFYPSIDHGVLKVILRRKIKDPDVLWLLDEVIDSANGIPIGNYLSQYFGNLYLTYFDHWMKEEKRCKYYFRYCDDVVVLSSNKVLLHKLLREVQEYLTANLKLSLKSNYQIFPVDKRGIDFLGYRFFHEYTLLRKSITQRFKAKVLCIKCRHSYMNLSQVVNGLMSYWGWMKYGNCLNLARKYIDGNIRQVVATICILGGIKNPLRRLSWL
jgi:RNA-directed DNA polymerase